MSNILQSINSIWAIQYRQLDTIISVYRRAMSGEIADFEAIKAQFDTDLENKPQGLTIIDGVAIVPIQGVIAKKMNLFHKISGGASTQLIERDFLQALNDTNVDHIILDIDSPGGNVDGIETLANTIKAARGVKPITAFIDGLGASAAFWIASAADRIIVSEKTAFVGSIGVFQVHVDESQAHELQGQKQTVIRAGKFKAFPDSSEPLTEEGQGILQAEVNQIFKIFVETVAENRGISIESVLGLESRILIAEDAIKFNLIDGIKTFSELLQEVQIMEDVTLQTTETTTNKILVVDDLQRLTAEVETMKQAAETAKKNSLLLSSDHILDGLVKDGKLSPGERLVLDTSLFTCDGEKVTVPFSMLQSMICGRPINSVFDNDPLPLLENITEDAKIKQISAKHGLDVGTYQGLKQATKLQMEGSK